MTTIANPINYCIQKIKNEIPKELLNIAVIEDNSSYNQNVTIDEKILYRVIKGYLMLDLNLVTTLSKKISLTGCIVTPYLNVNKEYEYLIEIPDEVLDGKEVVSASYILYNMLLPQMGMISGNALDNAMGSMLQAHSSLNMLATNRMDVVGRNMILVNTGNINWSFLNSAIELNLAPNPNLSHLKGTAIITLGDMALLCAKKWIYNTLTIQIDQGYIRGGHSIDAIRNKIDSFEPAFDAYTEMLAGWHKIALMSDSRQYQKFIEMQFG